jgi:hypothetical protein
MTHTEKYAKYTPMTMSKRYPLDPQIYSTAFAVGRARASESVRGRQAITLIHMRRDEQNSHPVELTDDRM